MIYIAIPSYDGKLHWTTAAGLVQTARLCGEKKIGIAVDVIPGDAFVSKARNVLVHRFLKTQATDLLFIDADVGFDAQGVIDLCRAEPPIVMGLYRMKTDDKIRFPALMHDPVIRHPGDRRLIKLQYGPAGFMRLRREVFTAMRENWPDEDYVNAGEEPVYDYFPAGRHKNHFTGEDINFCQRAQVCGFDIWAMQDVALKHTGEKTFESNWAIDVLQVEESRHGNIKMSEVA